MKQNQHLPIFIFFSALFFHLSAVAQLQLPSFNDTLFNPYYHHKVSQFKAFKTIPNSIIMVGNSITDGCEWHELFPQKAIVNRGISADISAGVINRLDEITQRRAKAIFLKIGTNDLSRNISVDSLMKNLLFIADYIHQENATTKLYMQSLFPVNPNGKGYKNTNANKNEQIKEVNAAIKANATTHHYAYINLYDSFCNQQGLLSEKYSIDGLHLNGAGYQQWKHILTPYIYPIKKKR